MIIDALLQFLIQFGQELQNVFGLSQITELPWGIDDVLTTGIGGYHALATYFPPLNVVMTAFIIYIGFRVVLMILRAVPFLGRTLS